MSAPAAQLAAATPTVPTFSTPAEQQQFLAGVAPDTLSPLAQQLLAHAKQLHRQAFGESDAG